MTLMQKRRAFEATALLASAARSADGNGDAVRLQSMPNALAFTLIVSDAGNGAGDLLDVYVQTKKDGTNWTDVVHFTQCAGNGGAVRHIGKVVAQLAQTMFAPATALAAGSVRHVIGDEWRVRWSVVDATHAEFTFEVWACPE